MRAMAGLVLLFFFGICEFVGLGFSWHLDVYALIEI